MWQTMRQLPRWQESTRPLPQQPTLTKTHFPGSRLQRELSVLILWVNFPSMRTRSPSSSSTATRMEVLLRVTETWNRAKENHPVFQNKRGQWFPRRLVHTARGQEARPCQASPGPLNQENNTNQLTHEGDCRHLLQENALTVLICLTETGGALWEQNLFSN